MPTISYTDSTGGIELIEGYRHKVTSAAIGEWNLWGRLREVIVGTPDGTIIPRLEDFLTDSIAPDLLVAARQAEGQLLQRALPDLYAALDEESRTLAAIYASHGVQVHFPRPVVPEELAYSFGHGLSTLFPCDVFW